MSGPPDYVTPFAQAAEMPHPDVGASLISGVQEGLAQQLARQQLQRQMSQQQQLDAARQQFIQTPTPESVRALAALDPQGFSAIKDAHAQQSTDQQKQDLTDSAAVAGYLRANRPDDALAIATQRRDAMKAAGQDPSSMDHLISAIQSDPKAALGMMNYGLAAILGPDKFGEAFPALEGNARANQLQPGAVAKQAADVASTQATTAKTQQETKNLANPLPETAATPGPDGNPIFYNPKGPPPVGAAASGGSPALAALIPKLIQSESSGSATIKNPNSSATGAGQFLGRIGPDGTGKGTWFDVLKGNPQFAGLIAGKSDAQILAMRSDPNLSAQVATAYAQQNAAYLSDPSRNLPVNGATIAMAHKLGPGGAQAVLSANPDAPLANVLPPEVIKANPQLAKLTAGQYANGLAKQFGTDPINTAPDPSATGDDYLATLPPGRAKLIKAIANGDAAMPTGRSAATGAGQALMQQVLQYDPTASAINLDARKKTREAFTGTGLAAQSITAANTVIGHIVGLSHATDQLQNTGLDWINGPAQFLGRKAGNKQTQAAVANFNFYKQAVATELPKVFRGSNTSEADISGWLKQIDSAKSPVELHSTINAMLEGMQSRLNALGDTYSQGMGRTVDPLTLLSPRAQTQLATLRAGTPASAPTVAKNAQGQTVVYDAASRTWKPG